MDAQRGRVRCALANLVISHHIKFTLLTVDPCDHSTQSSSTVIPTLMQLASLAADLCSSQVSQRPHPVQSPSSPFLTALLQLSMRLRAIASLLQEWVEGSVAYHAAVHSELRSLEAVAAACDSMALLLLLQAVRLI